MIWYSFIFEILIFLNFLLMISWVSSYWKTLCSQWDHFYPCLPHWWFPCADFVILQNLELVIPTSISPSLTISPLNLIMSASSFLSMNPFPSWFYGIFLIVLMIIQLFTHMIKNLECLPDFFFLILILYFHPHHH